jgi:hypothetical protein
MSAITGSIAALITTFQSISGMQVEQTRDKLLVKDKITHQVMVVSIKGPLTLTEQAKVNEFIRHATQWRTGINIVVSN